MSLLGNPRTLVAGKGGKSGLCHLYHWEVWSVRLDQGGDSREIAGDGASTGAAGVICSWFEIW